MIRAESIRKDNTKSTPEGEWEMRDGKWYRKDYYAAEATPAPAVCAQCTIWKQEIEKLKVIISERDRTIAELRARLEKWEIESRTWVTERDRLIVRIRELEALLGQQEGMVKIELLREKELLIVQLEERIRLLLAEKESLLNKLAKLAVIIEDFEKQFATCKERGFQCNVKPVQLPPPSPIVVPLPVIEPPRQKIVEEVVHHVQPVLMRSVTRRLVDEPIPAWVEPRMALPPPSPATYYSNGGGYGGGYGGTYIGRPPLAPPSPIRPGATLVSSVTRYPPTASYTPAAQYYPATALGGPIPGPIY